MSALDVRAALSLLTRLPVGAAAVGGPGAAAFGLAGAFVGAVAALPMLVLGGLVPPVAAVLAVAVGAVVSGGLHLDGLADTADALMARDPAAAERARKDPATGPGGVAALALVLGVEVASLASLAVDAGPLAAALALVAAASAGRAAGPLVAVAVGRAMRRHDADGGPSAAAPGAGGWFVAAVTVRDALVAAGTAVLVAGLAALAAGSLALAAGTLVGATMGVALALAVVRARRALDGDGLGAAIELTTAAALAATAALAALGGA